MPPLSASPLSSSSALSPSMSSTSSLGIPGLTSRPSRGVFGALWAALTSLMFLKPVFANITKAWHWIQPQHYKNTMKAQQELDEEYLAYHNEEWEYKDHKAEVKMMVKLAKEKPLLFAKEWVVNEEEGSWKRRYMAGLLKKINPQFYAVHRNIVGEAADWNERKQQTHEDAESYAPDLVAIDVVDRTGSLLQARSIWDD